VGKDAGMRLFKPSTPRYSIEKTDGEISIIINSRQNLGSILFLTLWIFIWTLMFSGLLNVVWQMFRVASGDIDPKYQASPIVIVSLWFFSVFLLLLLLLGIFGIYRFLWELAGKEIIKANKAKMVTVHQLFGWKRTKEFSNEKIDKLIIRNTTQSLFRMHLQKRYRYAFELNHNGKTYRFGLLVKEEDAKQIDLAMRKLILPAS
jgi:hypothetical protein